MRKSDSVYFPEQAGLVPTCSCSNCLFVDPSLSAYSHPSLGDITLILRTGYQHEETNGDGAEGETMGMDHIGVWRSN